MLLNEIVDSLIAVRRRWRWKAESHRTVCDNCPMILYILALILSGLVVGALGRLVIPGPNPMTIPMTFCIGIGGSLLGGLVGSLLFGRPGGLLLSVIGAALIVWLIEKRRA